MEGIYLGRMTELFQVISTIAVIVYVIILIYNLANHAPKQGPQFSPSQKEKPYIHAAQFISWQIENEPQFIIASGESPKQAYLRKAKQVHPDHHQNDKMNLWKWEMKFKKLDQEYKDYIKKENDKNERP